MDTARAEFADAFVGSAGVEVECRVCLGVTDSGIKLARFFILIVGGHFQAINLNSISRRKDLQVIIKMVAQILFRRCRMDGLCCA